MLLRQLYDFVFQDYRQCGLVIVAQECKELVSELVQSHAVPQEMGSTDQ